MLSREISLQRRSIGSRHFEQMLNGQAAKRDVIPSKRFCSGTRVCTGSTVMTDLQAYRFEPERVPNAEDSENEEVNDRLEGTFWVTCERCETMPTQSREQPEPENKMEGIILSLYCIGGFHVTS